MNAPNLQNVATFIKVVEVGGFAAAARELGVTQSTVSRRVAELERHLNRKLLERTTRRLLLTEAGATYCETVRTLISGLAEADVNLSDSGSDPQGLIRITTPLGLGRAVVLPGLARFAALHPRIRLEVDLSDRYIDILQEGYDFAVRFAEPHASGLEAKSVRSVERIICASPEFWRANPIERATDLQNDRCLVQRTYAPLLNWSVIECGSEICLHIRPRMVLSEIYSIYDMTRAGMGAAILPDFLVADDLKSGRLVGLQNISLTPRRIVLVWPTHKAQLRRVVAIREFLLKLLT
ncbi:LysR family transcriptional regulator [Bradyrhizobium liaoningense]|uniref:LysR family transcriptional regulator n=1 Tax=Bradyrhizobium liaoningense TaxID=43992 RepID=UPI001BAE27C8|nr:LysR family transcriptional regulator [Bradyrhizobium liaoningense]MBR0905166.1 LysR family transcriptional regulator [Bradyrhizobium liaoningense]